ncbi:hypothetical protein OBBRIDRAFT_797422 [Obba rivulosa]|uniref:Actin cytoskeleton-regulatory complex protein PAN1 n=1 Tax=Obba rivulosa TaxID=1052685 RepID=A0A8E2DFQ1_9APHY|nr:hypothetical protein OBBRIDRAFT_797422 [Obba rivulosa]
MAQWGQGYQYPLQTGFNQQGFNPTGGIAPQPTGFPGQRPVGLQPQQTGFPGPQGFQQPQQTGFPGQQGPILSQQTGFPGQQGFQPQPTGFQPQQTGFQGSNFQQRAPPPPVPPIPSQFQPQQNVQGGGLLGLPQQGSRFGSSAGGLSPAPLAAQPTGFAGGALRPLVPQMTGFVDPRLAMMSSTFLPANPAAPYNPAGAPQLQQLGGPSLQQSFQQHNQAQRGSATPKVPWALSKGEKKSYDQIFRAWDTQGTGFISGQTALEVFGQSGLDKNDLAKIWALADADNRGKLNLAEFHVAMGLIYRRLNGNEVPDELPPELVPPSRRDLDESVNVLKDILKNDPRAHSPSNFDTPVSRLKERSFNSVGAPGAGTRQDATVYKYKDESPPGGFYQSRSRHVDRSAIRTRADSEDPASDLSDVKRQLEDTARRLDRAAEESASRTAEDEALERELSDLKYKVKRVQEDLEYVSHGPRTVSKDEERRKLERELLKLMHERVPEVERKIKDREERKAREKREWTRERDRRNDRFGRYDDRDEYSSYSRYDRDGDRDRDYRRYDRDDRDRDRGRDRSGDRDYERERDRSFDRDRPYSRNRERDYDRPRSPPTARSPPPPPPSAPPSNNISKPPPPPPTPSNATAMKNMTPEERQAFIRAEAQRRLQERMATLGVTGSSPSTPKLDTSVEDRLAREKKEAEEKARAAEREAEERERLRRERLEVEKTLKDGKTTPSPSTPTAATPAPPPPPPPAAQVSTPKSTPPPPKPRTAPAPPPPRKAPAPRPPPSRTLSASVTSPPVPALASPAPRAPAPAAQESDSEDEEIRARQAMLKKQRDRLERLRQLEKEEEEARRAEEEYRARRQAFEAKAQTPVAQPAPPTPASVASPAAPPPPPAPAVASPPVAPAAPPPPPPPPPAPASAVGTPSGDKSATNPFSRLLKDSPGATAASPSSANGSTNPFFKSQPTSPEAAQTPLAPPAPAPPAPLAPPAPPAPAPPTRTSSVPPPSKSPAPAAIKTTYHTAPGESEDDWDEIEEKEVDESSEDELDSSRDTRNRLAQQLFGSILPPSRPQSAAPMKPTSPPLQASSPTAPPPPPPPSAPPAMLTTSSVPMPPGPPGAPAPPPPPPAPVAPVIAAPQPSGDRSMLLSSIQSGAKLRKVQTNDRSAAGLSGRVLGDAAPPPHVNVAPREPSPPPAAAASAPPPPMLTMDSVGSQRSSNRESVDWYAGLAADSGAVPREHLPPMQEEEEPVTPVPQIQVNATQEGQVADVDKAVEYRVRSLFAYEGQRPEDLSFGENLILIAHPSKSGGDWWYGTLVKDGKAGFFPKTYVERVLSIKAKALYAYAGNSPDELPFEEGDELSIVDRADPDWWKAEQGGVVFIVPAGYLEIVEGLDRPRETDVADTTARTPTPSQPTSPEATGEQTDDDDTTDSDYLSSSDSESEDDDEKLSEEARVAEREVRELARLRVLEAAGFIIKSDAAPPPTLGRQRSHRKRRPPPAVPERTVASQEQPSKNLPLLLHDEPQDSAMHLDDAFERYEAYKQVNVNRLSVISVDTTVSEAAPPTPTVPRSPSVESTGEVKTHSFLSFFGRSRTPAHEEETKTRPTISAPILQKDLSSTPTDGSSFGSTWGSLIDPSALEEIPSRERRRQEAIFELIATEATYVRDLQLIVEVFYTNLLPVLDQKAITVIFANVEDLLLSNITFLSCLEERQRECRLYIDRIGDVLKNNMAQMTAYMEYCVNQATAANVLQAMRQSDPELSQRLQRLREDPAARNLDLSSYLLSPMQRITRYPLLIKQILHYTDPSDDRKQVERALKMAERILEHINETIREQEGRERLRAISRDLWIGQGRLDLTAPTRYMGPRKLLREGLLMKAKSGRKLRAFLCSDILVLTEDAAKTLYRTPIPLSGVQVKEVSGGRDDLCFQITIAYPRGGDAIALRATSARDCQLWMQAIDHASHKCRDAEKRALRKA